MSDAPRERPRRRWGCSCWSILLVFVLVSLVIYLVAWNSSATRLAAEMQRLKNAGEHLKLSELVPQVGEDEDNAAVVYEQAFNIQPSDAGNYSGANRQWTPAEAAAARALVAGSQEYFDTLEEASRIPKCVFEKDWEAGPYLDFPEYARFREAARALQVRAEVQRTGGRFDDAAASCVTCLRIASHSGQSPILTGYLVSVAIQGIAINELEQVFSSGDPSPGACRALYDQLGQRAQLDSFAAAMKGERASCLAAFDLAERQGGVSALQGQQGGTAWLMDLYPLVGRPLWNQDKLHYLQFSQQNIDAVAKPYREALQELEAAEQAVAALPPYSSVMTRMMTPVMMGPVFSRALRSAYRSIAYARAAQVAAAAKAYKGAHGRYPASLEELARGGWRLPLDPFTDRPFHYAREGRGLAVWSIGPDLVDNRGTDYDPGNQQHSGGAGCDYVFRCAR